VADATAGSAIELKDIQEARGRLEPYIHRTELSPSRTFTRLVGLPVYLKLENRQRSGSFKIRGALNRILLLDPLTRRQGVICASMGNHAQGVALACQLTRTEATVVMPETAPRAKIVATQGYGARVVLQGKSFEDANEHARQLQADLHATFVHAYEDAEVIAGQGTIGLEILEDLPEIQTLLVPIGGGGLAAGTARAARSLRPDLRIIGVQAAGVDTLSRSFRRGYAEERNFIKTIADGIAVKRPGKLNLEIIKDCLDDVWTVDDEEIAETILLLLERNKSVVEGAGAASLAAAIRYRERLQEGPLACVISGGNIDVGLMGQIISRGLVKSARFVRVALFISDRPGSLAALLGLLGSFGVSVVDLHQDRMRSHLPLDETAVELELETNGPEHVAKLREALRENGYRLLE
jgi:threonine dehydratase